MPRSQAFVNRFPTARRELLRILASGICVAALTGFAFGAGPQKDDKSDDKNLDIRSAVGDLHVGKDADAKRAGLPLYPGARIREDAHRDRVNLGILTEGFGMKLVVANYDSDDSPARIIDYYRDKLKKYGKVLECHTREHGGNVHADVDDHDHDKDKDQRPKELKCEDDNTGPITELKVGTEENQHVVAVEPAEGSKGATFTLVYVHTRGKQGEI
jgi:hypothetical protein